ncbi:NADPH-dependent ferric siderophore reductase [Rhodobacter sp. TJ_12]|uniref:siderophore-interacting protein n=1 Tax=Rhodobacter sp. TJ_12 TaxID=2029399 RepID=UPI001CBA74B4|nr:siderophore-interacting protein [Rhodobacter sp. TJ_12]MBZ4023888.1 NADPH-dependent ferric siderophore reductase [Rhodobacter sp. TJ_12]
MTAPTPIITRQRFEVKRRKLTVLAREEISPQMLRLVLGGPELVGFASPGSDDHIKLFVPDGAGGQAMRDYTPRAYDPKRGTLTVDFALHEAGPATAWARGAQIGDPAEIGGPRGAQLIDGPIARWLLIGDETALPAIARRIEELALGTPVTSLVAVQGPAEEQKITSQAEHVALWVHRTDPTDASGLLAALARIALPEQTFVWIAAEAGVAKALRAALTERGHPTAWLKAAGYWVAGAADRSEKEL